MEFVAGDPMPRVSWISSVVIPALFLIRFLTASLFSTVAAAIGASAQVYLESSICLLNSQHQSKTVALNGDCLQNVATNVSK